MRKFIVPLLVAGMVTLSASASMAAAAFTETIAPSGNHYKSTDLVEHGHATWQLSSAVLKSLGDTWDGDTSFGYVTGTNPFKAGWFIDPWTGTDSSFDDNTSFLLPAPLYSTPCPDTMDINGGAFNPGDCIANIYASDPQSEHSGGGHGFDMLDDLYQSIGEDDSDASATRYLAQDLDILVFVGKNAIIQTANGTVVGDANGDGFLDPYTWPVDAATGVGVSTRYHYVIDQTLDQDVADWTNTGGEIMGIYGKLTQLFFMAGPVSSTAACASSARVGVYMNPGECNEALNAPAPTTDAIYASMGGAANVFDQWVVQDVWDWSDNPNMDPSKVGKIESVGMKQGYSSWWMRNNPTPDWTYNWNYDGGHGDINKTVSTGHDHIDP
ncbi:MAG: hypothetical protein IT393_02325 [Nitrospirae bacterium]|nr:hypothetical protein [Nitrospirota bacterium]